MLEPQECGRSRPDVEGSRTFMHRPLSRSAARLLGLIAVAGEGVALTISKRPRGGAIRRMVLVVSAGAALALGGCGGDDSEPSEKAAPKSVKLSLDTEQFAVTRGEFAELEGTVSPGDATV